VSPIDRILSAYERGLKELADDLVLKNKSTDEERAHLMLLARMLQAVVSSYAAHQLDQAATLQAAGASLFGKGDQAGRRVLNVSLRRLVDDNLMTPWYARFLNSNLQIKRTIIISGGPKVGKSTLLNALIDLLPRDHRVVAIDDSDEGLPILQDRSFTVQLKAKRGTPARNATFRKAAGMKPTWVVAGELARRDGPGFLDALTVGQTGGLTTVQSSEPESILNEWLALSKSVAEQIKKLNPLVVHLAREDEEQPRVERVMEVSTDRGNLVVTPREQVDTEQVGVPGGERSELARSEQESGAGRS
jgi:type IV secretory pathway ATPase VirB11/archaellum biosynthesis ATPase